MLYLLCTVLRRESYINNKRFTCKASLQIKWNVEILKDWGLDGVERGGVRGSVGGEGWGVKTLHELSADENITQGPAGNRTRKTLIFHYYPNLMKVNKKFIVYVSLWCLITSLIKRIWKDIVLSMPPAQGALVIANVSFSLLPTV